MTPEERKVADAMAAALRDNGHDSTDQAEVERCPGCAALAEYEALRFVAAAVGQPAVEQVLAAWERLHLWENADGWGTGRLPRFFWTAMERLKDEGSGL